MDEIQKRLDYIATLLERVLAVDPMERFKALSDDDVAAFVHRVEAVERIEVPIAIWRFADAPEEWRKLSTNGGDEDWLAVLSAGYANESPLWLEQPAFGCCDVDRYPLEDGRVVVIGSHA